MRDNTDNNKPTSWKRFKSSPWFGIVIGTVIGIAIAGYFYLASIEKPELTYFVYPDRTVIFRPGENPGLTVQFQNENITTDVTAAQIAFWNAGKKPICWTSDIRHPLVIRIGNNERIIDVRLRKKSRDVVKIGFNQSREALGQVTVDWDTLEKNDGGVLQIVYVGDEKVKIQADAILIGQPKLVEVTYPEIRSTRDLYSIIQRERQRMYFYILDFLFLAFFLWYVLKSCDYQMSPASQAMFMVLGSLFITGIFMSIYNIYWNIPAGPPFGF